MKRASAQSVSASAPASSLGLSSFSPQTPQAEKRTRRGRRFFSRAKACLLIGTTILAGSSAGLGQASQSPQEPALTQANSDAYATAVEYVVRFYPLWFSDQQAQVNASLGTTNRLVAPDQVSPRFKFVVASNYDTLYSSSYLDLTAQPVLVTVPATKVGYSALVLDPYGTQIPAAITTEPEIFAFTGPGFSGTLPPKVIQIPMPTNFPLLNWRMVKFSPTGEDLTSEAEAFRASMREQTLSDYLRDPLGGPTLIVSESYFTKSFKVTADRLIATNPIKFLQQLQQAVKSPTTPLLSDEDQELSNHFDSLFCNGNENQTDLSAGTRTALAWIISNYLTHTGPSKWIHFTNIAAWGDAVLDRASISEYLQQSNGIGTAAYYHAFSSGDGQSLDGTNPEGYVLTFPAGQTPAARLFWSVTAYTPDAIELVPNCANKYLVASYTPELTYNGDGSLTIYLSTKPPANGLTANWLPIPKGKFNIVLRIYGPTDSTYVPPAVQRP
jgi:hypothetical protein